MCTTCIYGPGCRVELHKTHLHQLGQQPDWHHMQKVWPGVGLRARKGGRERPQQEHRSGRFSRDRSSSLRNKWVSKGNRVGKGSSFDVCIAKTEITQSSLFHPQQTEKELQEKWWCNFKTAFLDNRTNYLPRGFATPMRSGCTASPECCLDKCMVVVVGGNLWLSWEDPRMHAWGTWLVCFWLTGS